MKTTLKKRMLRLSCISVVVASLIVTIAAEIGVFSLSSANTEQNGLTVTSIAEKTFNEEIIYLTDCLLEAEESLEGDATFEKVFLRIFQNFLIVWRPEFFGTSGLFFYFLPKSIQIRDFTFPSH